MKVLTIIIAVVVGIVAGMLLYPVVFKKEKDLTQAEERMTKSEPEDSESTTSEQSFSTEGVKNNESAAIENRSALTQDTSRYSYKSLSAKDLGLKFTSTARGINLSQAYQLFHAYHRPDDPSQSKACLKTTVGGQRENIEVFFLDEENFIAPLRNLVLATHGQSVAGYAGIPCYIENENRHSMIWTAVLKDESNRHTLVLPDPTDTQNYDLMHDYIDVCPNFCYTNSNRIWNVNWQ